MNWISTKSNLPTHLQICVFKTDENKVFLGDFFQYNEKKGEFRKPSDHFPGSTLNFPIIKEPNLVVVTHWIPITGDFTSVFQYEYFDTVLAKFNNQDRMGLTGIRHPHWENNGTFFYLVLEPGQAPSWAHENFLTFRTGKVSETYKIDWKYFSLFLILVAIFIGFYIIISNYF